MIKAKIEKLMTYLSLSKELGDKAHEERAYYNLGIAYGSLGDFKQAIDYHMKDLNIVKELGDIAGEGRAYGNLGNAYLSLGDFKQAMDYHKEHLNIAKKLGDRAGEGRAYCNLGNAYHKVGDFKQAMDYHKERLSISKELGDISQEGRAYCSLGIAFDSLGDFEQAIDSHKKCLSIAKELGQRDGEGSAYSNLGIAYRKLGDYKQAIEYHKKHLSIAKELEQRDGEGRAYANLGNAYQSLGDFEQAIDNNKKSLSISKELGDIAGEGRAYCNLGNAYHRMSDFGEAIDYYNKSLSIAKELGHRAGEGGAYGNLGNAYHHLGNLEKAIDYHKKHLSIAKELGQRVGEGGAYCNLGNVYHDQGDFVQAIDYHKKHFSISRELGQRNEEAYACYCLGIDLESSGALDEALEYYRSSVKLYNEVRSFLQSEDTMKISFRNTGTRQQAYTSLWIALLLLGKHDEALYVAEQGKAQALVDLLQLQYGAEFLRSAPLQPNVRFSDILSDKSKQTIFVALKDDTINLWVLGKERSVQFRQKKVEKEKAVDFLERLRKDMIEEKKIRTRVTCENRSLDKLGNKLPSSEHAVRGTGRELDNKSDSLRLFYDCILGPIADLLEGDEVIIVPDGPLCLVPFAAFVDDKSRHLSESFKIRILPSLTSLRMITECSQNYHMTSGALLVGDPCLEEVVKKRKPVFSQLPFAKKEVETIADMLSIPALTGRDATKEEVLRRIGSVALVHIAAHGDMEAGEIALAPNPSRASKIPKKEDYMLKLSDVHEAKMRARLVVLSCCHSAQGKVTPEGVVGIGRAFLGAGARSVLVSLWAIDDEATMEFMKSLYTHLKDGNSASVAVSLSMKCLRESERFGAVKYWAPFVLIGDDVTIEFGEDQ